LTLDGNALSAETIANAEGLMNRGVWHLGYTTSGAWDRQAISAIRMRHNVGFNAGDYEVVPDPEPAQPEPDWVSFNTAMLSNPNWQAWELPADLRNAMIAASINSNLVSLENAYAIAKASVPPSAEAIAGWQTLADTYNIPIVF
jgi:hypothetical protein